MSKPTKEQISIEIATLKELKPKIRHYTFFGDNNHDALDAQVDVLENLYDEDDIYNKWDDEHDHERDAALSALEWMNDGTVGGDIISLSEDWKNLIDE